MLSALSPSWQAAERAFLIGGFAYQDSIKSGILSLVFSAGYELIALRTTKPTKTVYGSAMLSALSPSWQAAERRFCIRFLIQNSAKIDRFWVDFWPSEPLRRSKTGSGGSGGSKIGSFFQKLPEVLENMLVKTRGFLTILANPWGGTRDFCQIPGFGGGFGTHFPVFWLTSGQKTGKMVKIIDFWSIFAKNWWF